jgi:D-3-phosphoglycerate dehydrogenase
VRHCASLIKLAQHSDVLSLHLPLTAQTKGIVDARVLAALPERAIVVNTARAEIVDHQALAEAIKKKQLRVGLDVFDDEPKDGQSSFRPAILDAGIVYGTPHIGASTEQAQEAIAGEVARVIRAFLSEEEVPNVVNVCRTTPARFCLVLRARDRVGVLANVLSVIKRHGLNIEEVHNTVFQGAVAACTKLRLSGRPGEDCLQEIRAFDEVLHVDVIPLPNLA